MTKFEKAIVDLAWWVLIVVLTLLDLGLIFEIWKG